MSNRTLAFTGFWIMLAGIVFGVAETIYFGNNWWPESKAEIICDAISLTLHTVGVTLWAVAFINQIIVKYKNIK